MSTIFDVLPHRAQVPCFGDVITLATPRIEQFLARHGVQKCPPLRFDVRDSKHAWLKYALHSPMRWDQEHYAWFYFKGVAGGTDVYCRTVDDLYIECWAYEKAKRAQSRLLASHIDECLQIGFYWSFRRSAGQPALINLAYGYLAAALGELTDGLIYSADNAWDYERFPCRAEELYGFYFEPEKALSPERREWAERCIAGLAEEADAADSKVLRLATAALRFLKCRDRGRRG